MLENSKCKLISLSVFKSKFLGVTDYLFVISSILPEKYSIYRKECRLPYKIKQCVSLII